MRDDGNVDAAFAEVPTGRLLEADYSVPFLAQMTMEPQNATARFSDGKLEIRAGNQTPTLVESLSGAAIGLDANDVTARTTFLGGSFGGARSTRRSTPPSWPRPWRADRSRSSGAAMKTFATMCTVPPPAAVAAPAWAATAFPRRSTCA